MNHIIVTTNGPLECRGELNIVAMDGKPIATETETWLCRCGQSANKPYCDSSHNGAGFKDSSSPQPAQPAGQAGESGALRVTLRVNGPLRLDGPVEIAHPVIGLIFAGKETALCRCGHSKNKPFCDGTHRQTGFVA
jgi:CDGSH-type Zn-finger protein